MYLGTGRIAGMLAGGYCLSEGAVGAGESATERFSLNGQVGASPAASGPWQHTQALALQQAQRRGVLQRRQLLGHKGESAARKNKTGIYPRFFPLPS